MHKILLEEEVVKEEKKGGILEARRVDISKEEDTMFIAYDAIEMGMILPH